MKLRIFATVMLGFLAILVVGVLGLTGARIGAKLYFLALEPSWHATDATITSMHTISQTLKYGNQEWAPSWTYSYVVNGRAYSAESSSIAHGYDVNWYRFEQTAERDGLLRPVGATVQAYYDSGHPSRSVLDRATFDLGDALNSAIFILVLAKAVEFVRDARRRTSNRST